jgi:hypothetical protein
MNSLARCRLQHHQQIVFSLIMAENILPLRYFLCYSVESCTLPLDHIAVVSRDANMILLIKHFHFNWKTSLENVLEITFVLWNIYKIMKV